MSEIIQFPESHQFPKSDLDAAIDQALKAIPPHDREKLRFELIRTIDGYDAFFTQWSLSLPLDCEETLRKQIYDIAQQEHGRKMLMLKDIMRLKIKTLVSDYQRQK